MAVSTAKRLSWFLYYWLPVCAVAAFIFVTSAVPGKDIPALFPYEDILYHFAIYVILALFFIRALRRTGRPKPAAVLAVITVVFCALYGISDELHQLITAGRSCSAFDIFIDTAGSSLGAAAGGIFIKWRS